MTPQNLAILCASGPDRPRLIILNYPLNLLGYTYCDAELEAIAEIARKFRIWVLANEVYVELNVGDKRTSMAQFYPEGTIVSTVTLSLTTPLFALQLVLFLIPVSELLKETAHLHRYGVIKCKD